MKLISLHQTLNYKLTSKRKTSRKSSNNKFYKQNNSSNNSSIKTNNTFTSNKNTNNTKLSSKHSKMTTIYSRKSSHPSKTMLKSKSKYCNSNSPTKWSPLNASSTLYRKGSRVKSGKIRKRINSSSPTLLVSPPIQTPITSSRKWKEFSWKGRKCNRSDIQHNDFNYFQDSKVLIYIYF